MRDVGLAVGLPLIASLLLFGLLKPFFPAEAAGLATGALALVPFTLQQLRRWRINRRRRVSPRDAYDAAEMSGLAAICYCSLSIVGTTNAVAFLSAIFVRTNLGADMPQIIVSLAVTGSTIPPTYVFCFWFSRWLILSRANKVLMVVATTVAVTFLVRFLDFVVIPATWFASAYPWSSRTLPELIKFVLYGIPTVAIPLALGVLWYQKDAVRLRVAAMMRLLPRETQTAVAELIRSEASDSAAKG